MTEKPGMAALIAEEMAAEAGAAQAVTQGGRDLFGEPIRERGRGRPKGAKNRRTEELREYIEATGITPAEYLVGVMRDPTADPVERRQAATALLPYAHRKQPVAVDLGGADVTLILGDLGGNEAEQEAVDGYSFSYRAVEETSTKSEG